MRVLRRFCAATHPVSVPATLVLSLCLLFSLSNAASQGRKKEPPVKTVHGQVTDKDQTPLPSAIVFLRNVRTNIVKTYIADDNGAYRFSGLDPNTDYEIHAEDKGVVSASHTISIFDNRKDILLNLKIVRKK
jgi:hypothetical protein